MSDLRPVGQDDVPATRRRDDGSVMPLVLVMMVVAALIVVPMLTYTVTVLRANTVVVESTRARESAEGSLRVALLDPLELFQQCDGGREPAPMPGVAVMSDTDLAASITCQQIEEVGPLNVLGYQTPFNVTTTQWGASAPDTLVGTHAVPPADALDEQWWIDVSTDTATNDAIWLPDLPTRPSSTSRSSTPYAMPPSFDCTVFLPGHYPDPVSVTTGKVYFASGVYSFEDTVEFSGDADIVVGYGVEGFDDSECADDVQVSANLLAGPTRYGIDGVGATFVFGAAGHLVIDNTSGVGELSVRFNQRYADVAGGGRVSIMSVNGDADDAAAPMMAEPGVIAVPESWATVSGERVGLGEPGAEFIPSSSDYTAAARAPQPPTIVSATALRTAATGPTRGALYVVWDEVVGQDAGGALVDAYTVDVDGSGANACPPAAIVAPVPGQLGCVVTGLRPGARSVTVAATNTAGFSSAPTTATVRIVGTSPMIGAPDPVDVSSIVLTPHEDAVLVEWSAAVDHGAPITQYDVVVQRVSQHLTPAPDDGDDGDGDAVPADPIVTENAETVSTCTTKATGWQAVPTRCVVRNVGPLTPIDDATGDVNLGYRVVITATNAATPGVSEATFTPAPWITSFVGEPAPPEADPEPRVVEPWIPIPIVDVRLGGLQPATVSIPGYVSVPMGRINVENVPGHPVKINGGLLAGTVAVDDSRATGPQSLPIGYLSDIVLQRRIKLVASVAGTSATAVVQINENGDFQVNSWVVG